MPISPPKSLLSMIDITEASEVFTRTSVQKVQFWAEDLFSIRFSADNFFAFEAGQYLRVALEQGSELIVRPYSIASSPKQKEIELYVSVTKDEYQGVVSSYLSQLKVGDPLLVDYRQAYGYLTINEVPEAQHLWLLASGVGLAPFLSIVRLGEVFERFSSVYLIHSARFASELGYADELRELQQINTQFRYLPFITRESKEGIFSGRITNAIDTGHLEKIADCKINNDSQFMICGNPNLIDECTQLLKSRGLRRNRRRAPGHITVEKFW